MGCHGWPCCTLIVTSCSILRLWLFETFNDTCWTTRSCMECLVGRSKALADGRSKPILRRTIHIGPRRAQCKVFQRLAEAERLVSTAESSRHIDKRLYKSETARLLNKVQSKFRSPWTESLFCFPGSPLCFRTPSPGLDSHATHADHAGSSCMTRVMTHSNNLANNVTISAVLWP